MLIETSNIIVLKLGSSTVVDGRGKFKKKWVTTLIKDIKRYGKNKKFVIVSSGAIALGQKYFKINKKKIKLDMSQAIAAVGQIHLASEFQKLFEKYKIKTGQILISPDDTEQRRRALNVRRTFDNLFKLNAIPIVNENDTTATAEIKYGDNDRLAARVAQIIGADTLIILSDVDGVMLPNGELVSHLNAATARQMITDGIITGGMIPKVETCIEAVRHGVETVHIINGNKEHALLLEILTDTGIGTMMFE